MNKYTPTPEMRTNPISLKPGGEVVTFIYDGYTVEYTNIKNPVQYITSVRKHSKKHIIGYISNGKTIIL
jgi:hypothetical protein|tara:strand:- start:4712 stop:4918 length:207 start_codon:yes stop_codon:yes gene_type:complete